MTSKKFDPEKLLKEQRIENEELLKELQSHLTKEQIESFQRIVELGVDAIRNKFQHFMNDIYSKINSNLLTESERKFTVNKDKQLELRKKVKSLFTDLHPRYIHNELIDIYEHLILDDYADNINYLINSDHSMRFLIRYPIDVTKLNAIPKSVAQRLFEQHSKCLKVYSDDYSLILGKLKGTKTTKRIKQGATIAASLGGTLLSPIRGGGYAGRITASFLMGDHKKIPKATDDLIRAWNRLLPCLKSLYRDIESSYRTIRLGMYANLITMMLPNLEKLGMELCITDSSNKISVAITEKEARRRLKLKLKYFNLSISSLSKCNNENDVRMSYEKAFKLNEWLFKQPDLMRVKIKYGSKRIRTVECMRIVLLNSYKLYESYMLGNINSTAYNKEKEELWMELLSTNHNGASPMVIGELAYRIKCIDMNIDKLIAQNEIDNAIEHADKMQLYYKDVTKISNFITSKRCRLIEFKDFVEIGNDISNSKSLKDRIKAYSDALTIFDIEWLRQHKSKLNREKWTRYSLVACAILLFLSGLFLLLKHSLLDSYDSHSFNNVMLADSTNVNGNTPIHSDSSNIYTSFEYNGQQWVIGPDEPVSFQEACIWVDSLEGEWRLPSMNELEQIYDSGIRYDAWGPFQNSGWFVWSGDVDIQENTVMTFTFYLDKGYSAEGARVFATCDL